MQTGKRRRIAAAIALTAVGVGALGLRAAPAVERVIARARVSRAGDATVPASGTDGPGVTYKLADLAGGPVAVAQTIAQFQKSGTFTGKREYAYYGYVKVQAVIRNGSLAEVKVVEYPNDNGRSHYINSVALPYLIQEAVDAQSYRVDFISGATFTSNAFAKSLRDALSQAGQSTQSSQSGATRT